MTQITVPLVGSHFRPPAKQVLAVLPAGAGLRLMPEPDNPYDAKAIRVLVEPGQIPSELHGALDAALDGTGHDISDVLAEQTIWLGYIADSDGPVCDFGSNPGNREVALVADGQWEATPAKLGFAPDGKPTVIVGGATP